MEQRSFLIRTAFLILFLSHTAFSVESQSSEDRIVRISSICSLPPETGFCRGAFPRYYFNAEAQECQEFLYGGCGGNPNNFETQDGCSTRCMVAYTSAQAPEPNVAPEFGEDVEILLEVDMSTINQERMFDPSEDEGGGNDTDAVVLKENTYPIFCQDRPDSGACDGQFVRFYFDPSEGRCTEFSYRGCGGNSNNFHSLSECARACVPVSQVDTWTSSPLHSVGGRTGSSGGEPEVEENGTKRQETWMWVWTSIALGPILCLS